MELLEPPRVVERPRLDSLGIREVTPFRGMLSRRVLLSYLLQNTPVK